MSQSSGAVSNEKSTDYDEVPYESLPFAQIHPDRLATIARIFGMKPAPIEKCRILELGSAAGGHIIPIAENYPESRVVGIDLSPLQIAEGQQIIDAIGLKNIELIAMSITDVTPELGEFDYIICHGVYSWIPDEVQDAIFKICEKQLAPHGVAYISYNCYPGWHFRGMLRDMMRYHSQLFTDFQMKVNQGRSLLSFLAESVPADSAYGIMLRQEIALLNLQADSYVFHEHLEGLNKPVYFHEFMARANKHNLQFLGEVEISDMIANNLSDNVANTLAQISNEIVHTEQYIDFVRNRFFRQTLLCKNDVPLSRAVLAGSISDLYVSSPVKATSQTPNIQNDQPESFQSPNGLTITTPNPLVKAALHYLENIWPRSVQLEDLVGIAQAAATSSEITVKNQETLRAEKEIVCADLLKLYTTNLASLGTTPPHFVTEVSDKPKATALARYQAKRQLRVTNQLHVPITCDLLANQIIVLCDGNRTQREILDALVETALAGELVIHVDGKQVADAAVAQEILAPMVREAFPRLAQACLLIG